MTDDVRGLNQMIVAIRLCFHRMKAVAEALHADLGITASMRGVLETLSLGGESTVPRIARSRGVSRQHIQVTVDALAAAGLVAPRPNPAHRRSPLIAATGRGAAAFAEMRRRETAVLADLVARLPPGGIDATRQTLQALIDNLPDPQTAGEHRP